MILRFNNVHTTLATALDGSDTTIDLAGPLAEGGVNVPTLSGGDVILLGIEDEVVELTAYTAGSTSGTITRGYGDTAAVAHDTAVKVANVITKDDVGSPGVGDRLYLAKTGITLAGAADTIDWSTPTESTVVGDSVDIDADIPRILVPGVFSIVGSLRWGNWATEGTYRNIDIYDNETPFSFTQQTFPPPADATIQIVTGVAYFTAAAPNPITFDYDHDGTVSSTSTAQLIITRLA